MNPTPFDFRRPPPGSLEQSIRAWLSAAGRSSGKSWSKLLPFPAEFEPGDVVASSAVAVDEPLVSFPLTTESPADGTAMLAMPRPLLLLLIGGLFGETALEMPADRDLTEVEGSAVGHVVRELFLNGFEWNWTGSAPLAWTAGPMQPMRVPPRAAGADMTIHAVLSATTPFGAKPVHLLIPRCGRWEELARTVRFGSLPSSTEPDRIAALVREMPVQVTVMLGSADLSMMDVSSLRGGDVVVFRQKVDEPLAACVSGARKFRVWAGTVGNRIAFQIDSPEPV